MRISTYFPVIRHMTLIFLTLTAMLLSGLFLSGCSSQRAISETGFYYDTVITVTLYGEEKQDILSHCMELADYYDKLLSPSIEGSDVYNINRNASSYTTVSEETISLLEQAITYAVLSDGLVSPSVGALSSLWDFHQEGTLSIPDEASIQESLTHIDYTAVHIKGNQVCLADPSSRIDLGFIAKGFIADRLKDYLLSEGVTSALINLGGNLVAIGGKPDNTPFHIGIQKPFETSGTAAITLELTNISIVSSGNYERYFIEDGCLYHHILSTRTGYPVNSGLSQVTILSENSMQADAFSTLCFILGYEKAVQLLENYPEIQAVFITEDGQILYHNFDQ